MNPVQRVGLWELMELGQGRADIAVALVDGPVLLSHPDLAGTTIREISAHQPGGCQRTQAAACVHGTLVAGILSARRGSVAPAICPGCTLLLRPIYAEMPRGSPGMPSATPRELAWAVMECVDAGARVINLSSALVRRSPGDDRILGEVFDYAARRSVIVVAAAGNQRSVGSSVITRHPWVIPVTACDLQGRPLAESNLGASIGARGLSAPGENIASLGTNGQPQSIDGTSAAAPFVTGTIALLWSQFPNAPAAPVRLAVTQRNPGHKGSVTPPMLDAAAALRRLACARGLRRAA
jgi:subtilisin family serine protease